MLVTSQFIQPIEENVLTDNISALKKKVEVFFNKNKKFLPEKIKEIESKLIKNGVDVDKIHKDAKIAAKAAKIKDNKITNFQDSVKKFTVDFTNKKYLIAPKEKQQTPYIHPVDKAIIGIAKSVCLLAVVIFLNTYFISLAISITGDTFVGRAIGAIFVAPIVEELGKLISVKDDFTWEYFTAFNIAEFGLYVSRMMDMGMDPITAAIVRIPPLCVHLFNTIIHVESKKAGKSEEGLTWTVLIHAIWNALATFRAF